MLFPYFSSLGGIPLVILKPRFSSSLYSWHTVILVSCIVPALRSVCYKYTATGNLWTVAEHTGSHLCSTLQISRRVSHRDWWFVVHKEKRMRRTPTCGAPVHNLSDTAKCNTGAPQSQATCNIGEEMKIWIVLNHMCKKCEKNWEGKPHTGADISEAVAEPNRPLPWHVVDRLSKLWFVQDGKTRLLAVCFEAMLLILYGLYSTNNAYPYDTTLQS